MKKIILIGGGVAVLLACGIGGTVAYFTLGHKTSGPATPAPPPPPKPPQFAELDNLVVSVPADSNDATTTYVQVTLQFASPAPNAVTEFTTLQPIIKAQVLNMLMGDTAKFLMDPTSSNALTTKALGIANQVMDKNGGYTPPDPFTAAYVTNLVEQN